MHTLRITISKSGLCNLPPDDSTVPTNELLYTQLNGYNNDHNKLTSSWKDTILRGWNRDFE